jgi:hypothetical protein
MGDMTIKIPDDIEEALERSFPGEDKAAVLLRLVRERLLEAEQDQEREADGRRRFDAALEAMMKLRSEDPALTDDDIRKARHEGRP